MIQLKRQIEEVWSPTLPVSKQHLADSTSVISNNNISNGLFQAGYPNCKVRQTLHDVTRKCLFYERSDMHR